MSSSDLASVKFDDCLLFEERGKVLALGHRDDLACHVRDVHINVCRNGRAFIVAGSGDSFAAVSISDSDHIANFKRVAGDVHNIAVHRDMAVAHHLSGLENCFCIAKSPHGGGETKFEQAQEINSGVAVHSLGFLERAVKLLFEHIVIAANDLLLKQLIAVFTRALVAVEKAVLAVCVLTLGGRALCLPPDVKADFAANVVFATSVCSHDCVIRSFVLGMTTGPKANVLETTPNFGKFGWSTAITRFVRRHYDILEWIKANEAIFTGGSLGSNGDESRIRTSSV